MTTLVFTLSLIGDWAPVPVWIVAIAGDILMAYATWGYKRLQPHPRCP